VKSGLCWRSISRLPQRSPCRCVRSASRRRLGRRVAMLDIILIAVGCGLFAAAVAYAYACERL